VLIEYGLQSGDAAVHQALRTPDTLLMVELHAGPSVARSGVSA